MLEFIRLSRGIPLLNTLQEASHVRIVSIRNEMLNTSTQILQLSTKDEFKEFRMLKFETCF